jgi:hypothetical protein
LTREKALNALGEKRPTGQNKNVTGIH